MQYLFTTANNYPEGLRPMPDHLHCPSQGKKDEQKFANPHNSPQDLIRCALKWLKPFLIQHFMSKGSCFTLDAFQASQIELSPIKLLSTMNKHTA